MKVLKPYLFFIEFRDFGEKKLKKNEVFIPKGIP
jgi:hypothetical protein